MTKNAEFNAVFAEWKRQNPNHAGPECEECGTSMVGKDVVHGGWGWYCSSRCRDAADRAHDDIPSEEYCQRAERQQMGICG